MKPPIYDSQWPDDTKLLYEHDMQEIWDETLKPHAWCQYQNQLRYYIGLASEAPISILDIGCAQGTLALMLAERGHRVVAVDIRHHFLEYAKSRYTHGDIKFLAGNAFEVELPGDQDLIFANQIFEHLVYPGEMLALLMNCLKPGGRLVVTTPNGEYLVNSLPSYKELGNPTDWEHLQFTADGDGHFFAYKESELVQIFGKAGFKGIRSDFFETPFVSGHMKIRYLHRLVPQRLLCMLDRFFLNIPWVKRKLTHQLTVIGEL